MKARKSGEETAMTMMAEVSSVRVKRNPERVPGMGASIMCRSPENLLMTLPVGVTSKNRALAWITASKRV